MRSCRELHGALHVFLREVHVAGAETDLGEREVRRRIAGVGGDLRETIVARGLPRK